MSPALYLGQPGSTCLRCPHPSLARTMAISALSLALSGSRASAMTGYWSVGKALSEAQSRADPSSLPAG